MAKMPHFNSLASMEPVYKSLFEISFDNNETGELLGIVDKSSLTECVAKYSVDTVNKRFDFTVELNLETLADIEKGAKRAKIAKIKLHDKQGNVRHQTTLEGLRLLGVKQSGTYNSNACMRFNYCYSFEDSQRESA